MVKVDTQGHPKDYDKYDNNPKDIASTFATESLFMGQTEVYVAYCLGELDEFEVRAIATLTNPGRWSKKVERIVKVYVYALPNIYRDAFLEALTKKQLKLKFTHWEDFFAFMNIQTDVNKKLLAEAFDRVMEKIDADESIPATDTELKKKLKLEDNMKDSAGNHITWNHKNPEFKKGQIVRIKRENREDKIVAIYPYRTGYFYELERSSGSYVQSELEDVKAGE